MKSTKHLSIPLMLCLAVVLAGLMVLTAYAAVSDKNEINENTTWYLNGNKWVSRPTDNSSASPTDVNVTTGNDISPTTLDNGNLTIMMPQDLSPMASAPPNHLRSIQNAPNSNGGEVYINGPESTGDARTTI